MRPRVFPAEDYRPLEHEPEVAEASMRPRVFPAEDAGDVDLSTYFDDASMRPRVFPAEDSAIRRWQPTPARGFNEAAGIPRGRLYATKLSIMADFMLQ